MSDRSAAHESHVRYMREHARSLSREAYRGFVREGPGVLVALADGKVAAQRELAGTDMLYAGHELAMDLVRSWVDRPAERKDRYEELIGLLRSYEPEEEVLIAFLEEDRSVHFYRAGTAPAPAVAYATLVN